MCEPISATAAVLTTGAALANHFMSNNTADDLSKYQSQVALNNQIIAQQQEQNIVNQGVSNMQQQQLKTSQAVGANRARMAASGLDINVGTPADVLSDTASLGLEDANNIRNNAINQAYAASGQVMNATAQADLAHYNTKNLENQNMLGDIQTGLNVGQSLYNPLTNSGLLTAIL